VKVKSYQELEVWKKAHELALLVFGMTERFPKSDQYGIVSQARRPASSVPANIAEGFGRGTTREFLRSLQIARGELEETRYFMLLSRDRGRISKEAFEQVDAGCDSTGRLIKALGKSLRGRLKSKHQSPVTRSYLINIQPGSKSTAPGAKAPYLRSLTAGLKPRPSGRAIYEMACSHQSP
jgi:four helix bundle protein